MLKEFGFQVFFCKGHAVCEVINRNFFFQVVIHKVLEKEYKVSACGFFAQKNHARMMEPKHGKCDFKKQIQIDIHRIMNATRCMVCVYSWRWTITHAF